MKHTLHLKRVFIGLLAIFLTASLFTACGNRYEREAKSLTKKYMKSLDYDAPSATVRAFFEALAAGKMQVAESLVEKENIPIARRYIGNCFSKTSNGNVWIGPNSYIWAEGNLAAVDYYAITRENVMLIRNGRSWKIRFQDSIGQRAIDFPDEISDKNRNAFFTRDKYSVKLQ